MAIVMALLLFVSCSPTVLAQDAAPVIEANMKINATWDGGDMLTLDILDLDTMERHQVAIRLSDFLGAGDNAAYILLQAMDISGERQSEVIQIENPLFNPTNNPTGTDGQSGTPSTGAPDTSQSGQTVADSSSAIGVDELPDNLQDIIANPPPSAQEPPTLTPEGTGTVVDNIMTVNDIEFFTVTTYAGNDFFLVIDRQRATDNVYLLNMVTEADLMALAEAGNETAPGSADTASAQPSEPQPPALTMEEILRAIQESNEQNQPGETPPRQANQGSNSGILFLAGIVAVLVGGAAFVWKYVLPRLKNATQNTQSEDDYDGEYDDEDDDYSEYEAVEADEDEVGEYGDENDHEQD